MIRPVILSGGSGTRLWPLSRSQRPKQFINLIGDKTPFQNTLLRLPNDFLKPLIICNEDHRFLAAEQLREINIESQSIILEPFGRNTAPAITLAALELNQIEKDSIMLVLPADHHIGNIEKFQDSIMLAASIAEKNKLVTFGVLPNRAETGYGYIKAKIIDKANYFDIESFTEKPDQANATKYFKARNYLWNSGMFMFKASVFLEEVSKFEPEILSSCKKSLINQKRDLDFIRLDNNEFLNCKNISVDYAIMEKTKKTKVVPIDVEWSDIGSWQSLAENKRKDQNGNVTEGDVILENVNNSYFFSQNRLISAIGISDLIVVDTQDAILITTKTNSKDIKKIIKKLRNTNRLEVNNHRKVFRPWGFYDSIDIGDEFHVKRIQVKPKAKLSLQKHLHRAEHWVVVNGVARVTCGKNTFDLDKNQSTFIPKGEIHRLENLQDYNLEIIEVQTGKYLEEDDIIRFKDEYNRD